MLDLLRYHEVTALVNRNEVTLRRMVARGEFPPPVRVNPRCVGWPRDQIEKFLQTHGQAFVPAVQTPVTVMKK